MQAEGHMTLEHFHLSQPARRPSRDPLIGPLPPGRLNTADPRRLIFPFDDPVQGSAAGLVQMDKNQRVAARRGCRSTRGLRRREVAISAPANEFIEPAVFIGTRRGAGAGKTIRTVGSHDAILRAPAPPLWRLSVAETW